MVRVPMFDRADLDGKAAVLYDRIVETRGQMPTLLGIGFHSAGLLERLAGVGEFLRRESVLDAELRQLATLAVANEAGCAYEWAIHREEAEALGIPEETIEAVERGELDDGAIVFVRKVAAGVPIDDAEFATLERSLGTRGLYELTVMAGYYLLLARLADVFQVEPPEESA